MESDENELLFSVPAIADAFKLTIAQVYHLKAKHGLPTFKMGKTVCAKRSAVRAWIEQVADSAASRPKS